MDKIVIDEEKTCQTPEEILGTADEPNKVAETIINTYCRKFTAYINIAGICSLFEGELPEDNRANYANHILPHLNKLHSFARESISISDQKNCEILDPDSKLAQVIAHVTFLLKDRCAKILEKPRSTYMLMRKTSESDECEFTIGPEGMKYSCLGLGTDVSDPSMLNDKFRKMNALERFPILAECESGENNDTTIKRIITEEATEDDIKKLWYRED